MKTKKIRVRYCGPDNEGRGARYVATAGDRRLTIPYDYVLGAEGSALKAAQAMSKRLGLGEPTCTHVLAGGERIFSAPHRPSNVKSMLDLSTAHLPEEQRLDMSADGVRFVAHEHGWIVFVNVGIDAAGWDEVPGWLRPVYRLALDHNCILINFDRDADIVAGLPTWEP